MKDLETQGTALVSEGLDPVDELVERLRAGDSDALADLFSIYRDRMHRMLQFRLDPRLNGRVSASDVLQEAYLDAHQRLDHFREKKEMSFFLWLRLITRQRMIELHRQHLGARMRDARQEVRLDAAYQNGNGAQDETSMSIAQQLAGPITSPSQAAVRSEAHEQLEEALSRMDPIDREVLALRHFEELSNNEVAEVLGLQKSAASNRYVRALKRLREMLTAMPGFRDELS